MEYYNDFKSSGRVVDLDAILVSIINILSTKKKTIILNREFGFNLEEFLFMPNTQYTKNFLDEKLNKEIRTYMTISDNYEISYDYSQNAIDRKLEITITITNKLTNETTNRRLV